MRESRLSAKTRMTSPDGSQRPNKAKAKFKNVAQKVVNINAARDVGATSNSAEGPSETDETSMRDAAEMVFSTVVKAVRPQTNQFVVK